MFIHTKAAIVPQEVYDNYRVLKEAGVDSKIDDDDITLVPVSIRIDEIKRFQTSACGRWVFLRMIDDDDELSLVDTYENIKSQVDDYYGVEG